MCKLLTTSVKTKHPQTSFINGVLEAASKEEDGNEWAAARPSLSSFLWVWCRSISVCKVFLLPLPFSELQIDHQMHDRMLTAADPYPSRNVALFLLVWLCSCGDCLAQG